MVMLRSLVSSLYSVFRPGRAVRTDHRSKYHDATRGQCYLGDERFESYEQWRTYLVDHQEKMNRRWSFGQMLAKLHSSDIWSGYCGLCGQCVRYRMAPLTTGREINFREELVCDCCQMSARVRAGFLIAQQEMRRPESNIYITEQASANFVWLNRQYPSAIGSEFAKEQSKVEALQRYLHDLGGSGEIRFEDVTELSFAAGALDVVISFDVLEHVPDYRSALDEFARVLKVGGMLVLTVPFVSQFEETLVRARINSEGEIEHFESPEYHGDPLGNEGILCFYHFGWDLLEHARQAGFASAKMVLPWSPSSGLLGDLWTLVAVR